MAYYPTPLIGERLDAIARKLLAASTLYAFIVLAITLSYASAGKTPPPLAPNIIISQYVQLADAWNSISGKLVSGNQLEVLVAIANLIWSAFKTLLVFMINIAIGITWISFQVSLLLPSALYPLKILAMVAGLAANTVLIVYLLRRTLEVISSFIPH